MRLPALRARIKKGHGEILCQHMRPSTFEATKARLEEWLGPESGRIDGHRGQVR